MADIAMLVAEEYERRVKYSAAGAQGEMISFVSCVSFLAHSLKKKIGHENIEQIKSVIEPKSQIGFAAFAGVFSA